MSTRAHTHLSSGTSKRAARQTHVYTATTNKGVFLNVFLKKTTFILSGLKQTKTDKPLFCIRVKTFVVLCFNLNGFQVSSLPKVFFFPLLSLLYFLQLTILLWLSLLLFLTFYKTLTRHNSVPSITLFFPLLFPLCSHFFPLHQVFFLSQIQRCSNSKPWNFYNLNLTVQRLGANTLPVLTSKVQEVTEPASAGLVGSDLLRSAVFGFKFRLSFIHTVQMKYWCAESPTLLFSPSP